MKHLKASYYLIIYMVIKQSPTTILTFEHLALALYSMLYYALALLSIFSIYIFFIYTITIHCLGKKPKRKHTKTNKKYMESPIHCKYSWVFKSKFII